MKTLSLILAIISLGVLSVYAQSVPPLPGIRIQASLTDNAGNLVSGSYPVTIRIYRDSSSGLPIYAQYFASLGISNGILDVMVSASGLRYDSLYWVETQLNNEIFAPRTELASVPYAFYALRSDTASFTKTIADSAVGSSKIQRAAIQFNHIGQNGAAPGQVVKWSGVSWVAAYDSIGWGAFLPLIGGVMKGPINCDTSYPAISMGKSNFGAANSNEGTSAVVAGRNNHARGDYSVIDGGGGLNPADSNSIIGNNSVIGGGASNTVLGINANSVIAGGYHNSITASISAIGGGAYNTAGVGSFIGGGIQNTAPVWSAISGGNQNYAQSYSFVGGGGFNNARGQYSVVTGGGGSSQSDSNSAIGDYSVISGGSHNIAVYSHATIGGGDSNVAGGSYSTIAGGQANNVTFLGLWQFIGGGHSNVAEGYCATVAGGHANHAASYYGTVAGGESNSAGTHQGPLLGNYATVAGGHGNQAVGDETFIGGGVGNYAGAFAAAYYVNGGATVSGGRHNVASAENSTIAGGSNNAIGYYLDSQNGVIGVSATISGGGNNSAIGKFATIGGGFNNYIGSITSALSLSVHGNYSTICGGSGDSVKGDYAIAAGGFSNTAGGDYSFAAGQQAKANHSGSFVWADNSNSDFASDTANELAVRASGGIRFYSAADLSAGVTLPAGASAWVSVSDSTKKRNARSVDVNDVLVRVDELPIKQWSYKSQSPNIEHVGPMAQDFHRIFKLGDDDKTISTIDPSGVALAAIQALHKENQELKERLAALEKEVKALLGDKSTGGTR